MNSLSDNERSVDYDWYRRRATNSQLESHDRDYLHALLLASLAEKWRQLKTNEAFEELEQALDFHWQIRANGRPIFGVWMFVNNTSGASVYGTLEDCLQALADVLFLDYEAEIVPSNLLDQIKGDCLVHGKFEHKDCSIERK